MLGKSHGARKRAFGLRCQQPGCGCFETDSRSSTLPPAGKKKKCILSRVPHKAARLGRVAQSLLAASHPTASSGGAWPMPGRAEGEQAMRTAAGSTRCPGRRRSQEKHRSQKLRLATWLPMARRQAAARSPCIVTRTLSLRCRRRRPILGRVRGSPMLLLSVSAAPLWASLDLCEPLLWTLVHSVDPSCSSPPPYTPPFLALRCPFRGVSTTPNHRRPPPEDPSTLPSQQASTHVTSDLASRTTGRSLPRSSRDSGIETWAARPPTSHTPRSLGRRSAHKPSDRVSSPRTPGLAMCDAV